MNRILLQSHFFYQVLNKVWASPHCYHPLFEISKLSFNPTLFLKKEIKNSFYFKHTWEGMARMLATTITTRSPTDTVNNQIAWTTDFNDVGAWKEF